MFDALKTLLQNEALYIEKFEKDIDLTQEEIDLIKAAYKDCAIIQQAINDELPRNIWGRKYRKLEDGTYVRDESGDYVSSRGIGGAMWFTKIGEKVTYKGNKFIGPFGA